MVSGLAALAFAAPLDPSHAQYEMYQSYSQKMVTLNKKPVALLEAETFALPAELALAQLRQLGQVSSECFVDKAAGCKPFRAYNPSVATVVRDGKPELLVTLRLSNWSLCEWSSGRPYGDWPESKWPNAVYEEYHSHVGLLRLDGRLQTVDSVDHLAPMSPALWERTRVPFFEIFRQGLEDVRLFSFRGGTWAVAVFSKQGERQMPTRLAPETETVGAFRVGLFPFADAAGELKPIIPSIPDETFVTVLLDFDKQDQQKNFGPFSVNDKLYMVHSLSPSHKVLEVDPTTGVAIVVGDEDTTSLGEVFRPGGQHGSVRGGTPAIHLPKKGVFLTVAHLARGRSMYTHFWYGFRDEPPFDIVLVGNEFCFAHLEAEVDPTDPVCEGVQFVAGVARHPSEKGKVLVTYGVQDCDARVAVLDLKSIFKTLRVKKKGKWAKSSEKPEL
mmetsp:Transcript_14765/g.33627  ORF Transcript_14765/g.33627 Transcript_14765/m.33627 type:complete len:443 (-) Transcript_14765:56-1384(-)